MLMETEERRFVFIRNWQSVKRRVRERGEGGEREGKKERKKERKKKERKKKRGRERLVLRQPQIHLRTLSNAGAVRRCEEPWRRMLYKLTLILCHSYWA